MNTPTAAAMAAFLGVRFGNRVGLVTREGRDRRIASFVASDDGSRVEVIMRRDASDDDEASARVWAEAISVSGRGVATGWVYSRSLGGHVVDLLVQDDDDLSLFRRAAAEEVAV